MKKVILLMLVLVMGQISVAQPYGNEWIDFTQKYFKLSTAQDGLYRVSYTELAAAGFPVATVDPRKMKLYFRGVEQSILVSGQNDARFDPGDYIDFYGRRNDGTLDKALYVTPQAHKNRFYNFYSDTTAFFLTWSLTENGKRFVPFRENNILNLPAEPYHLNEILQLQSANFTIGLHYPIGQANAETYLSGFDYGEGWTGAAFAQGQSRDLVFGGLSGVVKSGPKPMLEILLVGGNSWTHTANIAVGSGTGTLRSVGEVTFNNYYDTIVVKTLEWSDFTGDKLTCRVSIPNLGVSDRMSIAFARLVFADVWDQKSADQKIFRTNGTASNRSYIDIKNVPAGSVLLDITNTGQIVEIGYNTVATGVNAIIQNDLQGRTLISSSRRIQVPKIEAVSMRNLGARPSDFLIVTHKTLRKATSTYSDVPKAYGAYRASPAGGQYDTLVVNVDQLYNMFSYGEYSSLAIYRFCRFMAATGNPAYLFIMGKGLTGNYLSGFRNGTSVSRDLIPSAGFPGTDILYTAGLKGSSHEAGFPVGRVSAESAAVLEAYLDKVKQMEATPHNALWRKELVHLSGGTDQAQHDMFKRFVNGFKAVAEGELLGGEVNTISKKTNGATELINIAEYVNAGKMLVTFFGHSAAFSPDIEVGMVSNDGLGYHNEGKYPILIVNGCNAGDMYNTGYGFGEDWIGTPKRGAIGFVAHTGAGYTLRLKKYTDIVYEVALTDSLYLDKGFGDILKEAGRRYLQRNSLSALDISQVQQMSLQGDPAIKLFGVTKPDYEIHADRIFAKSLDGQLINAYSPAFGLGIVVQNFGVTHSDSLKISMTRKVVESGSTVILDTLYFKPVFYKDTLYFEVPGIGTDGYGLNQFTIRVDPLNEIKELSETNNETTFEYFVPLGGTSNLYPHNYSIVNINELNLVAQSLDLLSQNRSYIFEMDTSTAFASPAKQQATLPGNALAKWQVSLFDQIPAKDTMVYYWRTKFADPKPDELDLWATSSFTYIHNGVSGWAMKHFQQFDGNATHNVSLNQGNRSWEFDTFETNIALRTFGSEDTLYNFESVTLRVNQTDYIFPTRLCTNNSINMMAFDQSTTIPYLALGTPFILDRKNCGRIPQVINNMLKSEIESQLHIEKYIDGMGEGDYVLLFSIGKVTYQSWPVSTLAKLALIGLNASDIQSLSDGEPLIVFGKKGSAPGSAIVVKADYSSPEPPKQQELIFEHSLNGQAVSGTVRSPRIGPAASWTTFSQQTALSELPPTDIYSFDIYGISNTNSETLLYENVQQPTLDLSGVNVKNYPYLRLEMDMADAVHLSPPQLQNWFVLYQGVPEGVLVYKAGQEVAGIEKAEGETMQVGFAFENVSALDFTDSIAFEYRLYNHDSRKAYTDTLKLNPLKAREKHDFSIALHTLGKGGKNDLEVFANPYLQPEHTYNNNFLRLPEFLTVNTDKTNPVLEVTVDGQFIMDGDIVSPSPAIVLRMKDEEGALPKEDTLGVNLYLNQKCDGCTSTRVSFSSPNVVWTPASDDNDFRVEYRPQSLADGIYTLQAEASDASGNPSGTKPYSVNFEIINESQITNFFPYPNPFSTRTHFVFTLTGSEIPEEIIIQIMTVNGTVVREITQDEIGPIRIGNNKTEYAWNGRDEYGDQLANGVYLYKVKLYTGGKEMKHRATSADRAFTNGIGKMYLLR
ncbi:MAG: hypothetical protein HC819_07610 [Cyclobacteriaceae bacterium]|nr:hypothetical protein [Cyclobacteriaceae bacterium]